MGYSMSLVLPGATSGSVTIDAPAVAGTTTLALPSTSGTIALTGSPVITSQLPTGTILQVVQGRTDAQAVTTSTSPVTTGLSATITPTSASSKILVMVTASFGCQQDTYGSGYLYRNGSTNLYVSTQATGVQTNCWFAINTRAYDGYWETRVSGMNYLDSPATTSATTYALYYKRDYGGGIWFNRPYDGSNAEYHWCSTSSITLLEVAG